MAPESKTQVTTANEDISSEYPSVIGLFIPRTNKTKPYTPASSFRAHPIPPQSQTKSQVLPQLQTKPRTGKVKNFYPEAACTLLIITQD